MGAATTNLQFLRRSRKELQPGDVFRMKLHGARYLFGCVVIADMPRHPTLPSIPHANLIYVYDVESTSGEIPWESLTPDRLLIPPVFTNRLGWTHGVFETVGHRDLAHDDLLTRHCFRRWDGTYLDERGARLPAEVWPCGEWGLASYRLIDDEIADAIGIPRAPDNPSG
jgi:hypothetical protein